MTCKCCLCSKKMEDVGIRQPSGGTEFRGGGDYGSAITDHPHIRYGVYICDVCLGNLILEGLVHFIDISKKGI